MSKLEDRTKESVSAGRLSKFVAQLFLNDEFSDVTFCIEDQRFPAHRTILASRGYFRTLLFGPFAENRQKEIKLDADANSFKALLKYIYNDSIVLDEMESDELIGLFQLAHMYSFDELTSAIECHLKKGMSMSTVFAVLEVSQELWDSICEACLKFIDKNASAFLLHEDFTTLTQVKWQYWVAFDCISIKNYNLHLSTRNRYA